jgi:hypothetical protein
MLSAGESVQVADNGDGTFTLTLKDLKGGIALKVVARPVPNSDKVEIVEATQESTPTYADPTAVPAGAIVATTTTTAADTPAETAAISGTKPALTVAYSINEITPLQYKNSIIQSVATAPSGGAFNIQTDKVACFDRKMIEAFAARPDVDVNVVFTYGGRKLKVVIPAGFDVRTLLDEFGYCGFLRLMSILGASELNPVA